MILQKKKTILKTPYETSEFRRAWQKSLIGKICVRVAGIYSYKKRYEREVRYFEMYMEFSVCMFTSLYFYIDILYVILTMSRAIFARLFSLSSSKCCSRLGRLTHSHIHSRARILSQLIVYTRTYNLLPEGKKRQNNSMAIRRHNRV